MKPNALIIEDDPDTARLLGMVLDRNGWQFERASTLAEGVRRANSHPFPEIILLDLQLPDSMAAQTVARIPELMRNGPVLVLSNYEDQRLVDRITGMGAHFARKEVDRPGGEAIFTAMLRAIAAFERSRHAPKKLTDRIDLGMLKLRAMNASYGPA